MTNINSSVSFFKGTIKKGGERNFLSFFRGVLERTDWK